MKLGNWWLPKYKAFMEQTAKDNKKEKDKINIDPD